jgi:NADH dehydrogenase FAD-containing subunit
MSKERNIIILGASAGGLQATHYILKHILPALKAKNDAKYHVYTISPSSKWFFRVASPRVAASTSRMASEDIMFDLPNAFRQYSSEDFTFVEASATGLDTLTRTVSYRSTKGAEETLQYHALVVATGSKTYHPAFSMSSDAQSTLDSITSTNKAVNAAKKIVIVGGGPTAVEFAGEVGEHRNGKPGWLSNSTPKANITLITADKQLLPMLRPAIAEAAEKKLEALGVKVVYKTRVTKSTSTKSGGAVLTLSTGKEMNTDLVIPAYGVTPNSSWLPKELLNEKGYLINNPKTLRVDAAGSRVYALGDVASYSRNNIWDIAMALPTLAVNMKRDLLSYNSMLPDEKPKGKDRIYTVDTREAMMVPIGSGGGVGAIFGWKVPSWFVWMLKGRDYMLGMSGLSTANGKSVEKEIKWTKEEAAI